MTEKKIIGINDVLRYKDELRIKHCPCCGYETDCVSESSGATFSTLYCGNCYAKVKIESNEKYTKQKHLASKHHTCTCDPQRFFLNLEKSKFISVDFESPQREKPEGRIIWFISECGNCGHNVFHGRSFCDYRLTGTGLILAAFKEAKQVIEDSYISLYAEICNFYAKNRVFSDDN